MIHRIPLITGPYRRPSLLQRLLRRIAWLVGA